MRGTYFAGDSATGELGKRLQENAPNHLISKGELIAQGEADSLIPPTVQAKFVQQLCHAGQSLEYRTYKGRDHVGVVEAGSVLIPDLIRWTQDRLAGKPQQAGCHTIFG